MQFARKVILHATRDRLFNNANSRTRLTVDLPMSELIEGKRKDYSCKVQFPAVPYSSVPVSSVPVSRNLLDITQTSDSNVRKRKFILKTTLVYHVYIKDEISLALGILCL